MSNYGLRGHETVIRMVGKRRKLTLSAMCPQNSDPHEVKQEADLPSLATSINSRFGLNIKVGSDSSRSFGYHENTDGLRTAINKTSQPPLEQKNGNLPQNGVGTEKTLGYVNWVQCPICTRSIRGDVINIHLDVCLQGGLEPTKRKSKQLTMSQFGGSSSIGKLSSQPLPAQLGRVHEDDNWVNFGSVKQEVEGTFRLPQPISLDAQDSLTSQSKMDLVPRGLQRVKLEDTGAIGPPQPVSFGSLGKEVGQSRMRLKRLRKMDGQKTKEERLGIEEPGQEKSSNGSLVCIAKSIDQGTMSGICRRALKEFGQDKQECEKDPGPANTVLEPTPSSHRAECACLCHSHISTSSAESMDNASGKLVHYQVDGEGKVDRSREMVGVVEKINTSGLLDIKTALDILEITTVNSSLSQCPQNGTMVGVLDTKIVGRRFNRGTTCKEGMKVTVLREPDNPMDPNAIKIVPAETPSGPALGHLSREISFHLSGLIDNGFLQVSIQGSVTAVPEQAFGAVPIQLFCESKLSKEDFSKLSGAQESFSNALLAAKTLHTLPRSSSASSSKYQQNFLFMLQTILSRDSHLFKDSEKNFLETFSLLSDDAQRLFVRLYQRKGPWFRLLSLEYEDIVDVGVATEKLLASGYMTAADSTDDKPEAALRKRFQVLNAVELRQFVCTSMLKKKSEATSAKKEDLVTMAVSAGMRKHADKSQSTLVQMLADIAGKCVRISDIADFLLWRVKRLFFLNGDTDLSAFLLVDMGLIKYPRYKCWRARNVFETRDDLLSYEQALEVAQGMDMALECDDIEMALKLLRRARDQMSCEDSKHIHANGTPTFLTRFSASYVYRNLCTLGVSILERERRYSEAVDVLRQLLSYKARKSGRWGYWTVRLSMDLDHLGRKEESLQVAEEGVNDPWIRGGDRVALQRRVVRLGKPPRRWKKPPYAEALNRNCKEVQIQGRPLNCVAGVKSRFYGYDGQQCGVEELALQFYASEQGGEWHGVHCEGGVWMTFFGLLMWDVLFADVPDVFQTSFQTAPLDLDTEVFFSSRQSLIEAKLAAIAQGDTTSLLAKTWNEHLGTVCQGVNWERHSLQELQTIASCIGGPGLSTVCRLLAEDHAGWNAGMPDLLLWRADTEQPSTQVTSVSGCCTRCGCTAIKEAPMLNKIEGTCTVACSLEIENRSEKGADMSRESFYSSRSLTIKSCSKRGEAKLVEVKGPRDRLSEQQRAWIWILMNAGLTVEVCKVLEQFI